MGIEVNKIHIPVNFELDGSVHDSRLKKVKIWIAHTGENLNNTYFTKEVLADMAKTLPYTPITGFIEKNKDEENDFSDHRMSLVIEKNKVKLEYQGHAYGFVSDEPNEKFEFRNGKEWLTCEGFLWTKFRQALEIFEEEDGIKSQSMEIQEVDGEVDEFGRMVFSEGVFSALCILGDHVPPAMSGSTAEFYSATKDSIREMIYEFSLIKGESNLIENEVEEMKRRKPYDDEPGEPAAELGPSEEGEDMTEIEDNAKPTEPLTPIDPPEETEEPKDPGVDPTPEPEPELEEPEDESGVTETVSEVDLDESETDEPNEESETEDFSNNKVTQFQLSYETLRQKLYELGNSLFNKDENNDLSAYVVETFDDKVIYEVNDWRADTRKFVQVNYTKENEVITLGETAEVYSMFVTETEKKKISDDRTKLVELEKEIASLQEYKAKLEYKEKEDVLDKFQDRLTEEESSSIREQFSKMSVLDIEKEIAYTCFTKSNGTEEFSGVRSVGLGATETSEAYGTLKTYFKKTK